MDTPTSPVSLWLEVKKFLNTELPFAFLQLGLTRSDSVDPLAPCHRAALWPSSRSTLQKLVPQLFNKIFIVPILYDALASEWQTTELEGGALISRISCSVVLYTTLSPGQVPLFVLPFVIISFRTEFETQRTYSRCVLTFAGQWDYCPLLGHS